MPEGYKARPEQVILFTVRTWDANCPQPIPRRIDAADAARVAADYEVRIAALEQELETLRARLVAPIP